MTKQEQIAAKAQKPFQIGDTVKVKFPYIEETTEVKKKKGEKVTIVHTAEKVFSDSGKIIEILEDGQYVVEFAMGSSIPQQLRSFAVANKAYTLYKTAIAINKKFISHTFFECGVDPFEREQYRINFHNKEIATFLSEMGYVHDEDYDDYCLKADKVVNFDPFITEVGGERKYIQRGLVWTLEQKQALIHSIYNWIEIGRVLFRINTFERSMSIKEETGKFYYRECVDGKQRLNTIVEFVTNQFPDSNGNYWRDLNLFAKRKFLAYDAISYGELSERATDKDVVRSFLTLNFTGTPMSAEHIEYVRSINI